MLTVAASGFAQNGLVTSVGNFIHDVTDLDRSIHFYRDVLGMELQRPPGDWQSTEGVLKMYDAARGQFRATSAQIPGSPMRVEMVEFRGVERQPARRQWGTAGTSVLMLTVADLASVQGRLKPEHVPTLVNLKKACDGSGMVVADPDGFAVMIVTRGGPAPAKSNFTRMRFGYFVSGDAIAKGPFAALGLQAETRSKPACRAIEDELLNGGVSVVTLPGGFEVWLAKGKPEKPNERAAVRPRDPGAAVLRLMVSDPDAAVRALEQAHTNVVSAGGAIQTLPPAGLRAAILRAPDDLFIQVVK